MTPGRGCATIAPSSQSALIAVAAITRTPTPMARSSTSNVGWWMSSERAEPGTRVPSRASAPGMDSRYQAKSSPPRLCGVCTTEPAPSTPSAAAEIMAALAWSLTVGGT